MSNPDDLEGNLAYDSESEVEIPAEPQYENDVLGEEEFANDGKLQNQQKRPLEDDGKTLSKRQKKLMTSKFHERKREQIGHDIDQKKSLPKSSTDIIAEYFAKLICEDNPDLSALELNDLYLKKSEFISTEKFDEDRDLANFPNFMTKFSKAPRCIIFSMSNMRVADVFRTLNGSKSCLKLFAKNKLKDDLASVEQSLKISSKSKPNNKVQQIRYFIATPTRMEKILGSTDVFFEGKDKLDIILDASYLDQKNNTLLRCENSKELYKVLRTILDKKSSVKILLY